jgi:hypothetical protein
MRRLLSALLCAGLAGGLAFAQEGKKSATAPAAQADGDGWTQLFNGKDFTGWKIPSPPSGNFSKVEEVKNADGKVVKFVGHPKKGEPVTLWEVKDGLIVGGGPASHIFSERGDYENFHYRVECKLNDGGNSGQYFRTAFGPNFPNGYEAQLNATHGDAIKTGCIYPAGPLAKFKADITPVMKKATHNADEFFTQEVIAEGAKLRLIVNGKETLNWTDPNHTFKKGHFALQGHDPKSVMIFKKVEVKEIK